MEIIAGTDKVTAIDVHDPLMVGEVGFDLNIMKIIEKYQISYILKSTSANSITMAIWDKDCSTQLIEELKERFYEITVKQVAIVSAMGTNIAQPGSLAKATTALFKEGINIEAVSQSLKQVNMQFVIDRKDFRRAVIALNDALCIRN